MNLLNQWSSEGRLNPVAFQLLNEYLDLLVEWNPRINLTGFRTRSEMEEILVGESLLAAFALPLSEKRILDFGSGAGIPGLIWLLKDPSVHLTSLEIREKKIAFQKEVVRLLRLSAEIVKGRFPEAVAGRKFDVIVSRAIRFSPQLWREALALLESGGLLVRFAATGTSEEGWESLPISGRSTLLLYRG